MARTTLANERVSLATSSAFGGALEAILEMVAGTDEPDLLDALGLPRAIATSSAHETVQAHLSAHGLTHRFDVVVGHGDYAQSKPAPDPFLLAAERLAVPAAFCLALEDSHNGVRAAHAAGMMTVMVPDLLPATDEMRSLCLAIAESLHEVRALLAET